MLHFSHVIDHPQIETYHSVSTLLNISYHTLGDKGLLTCPSITTKTLNGITGCLFVYQ